MTSDGTKETGTLASGETLECDFLVGVKSSIRESLFPEFAIPVPTGDLAYRFTVRTQDMLEDENLLPLATTPDTHSWWGPEKHVVGYMLRGEKLYNVVAVFPDDGSLGEATRASGSLEQLKEIYQGWCSQ